jgi:acetyl esterase/lipase
MLRLLLAATLIAGAGVATAAPTPPAQPASGPGGADYRHRAVVASTYGTGGTQFWLFEPAGPQPKAAPVVVFSHGWGGVNPEPYRAWIDHIVRRGNIVIYPRYQADIRTPPRDFTPNAIAAVRAALEVLRTDANRVRPDQTRFALVGHSIGGLLSANLAALAARAGLPQPRAVMSVEPGKTWNIARRIAFPLEDLSAVPGSTLLLAVAGDRDRLARATDARRVYYETIQVPPQNKNFVLVMSDTYGSPPLEAHHFAPLARGGAAAPPMSEGRQPGMQRERQMERRAARGDIVDETLPEPRDEDELPDVGVALVTTPDALDFYGFWKLFDALSDAAFYGRNREYALGNTPQQRYMGAWSDGRPVRELVILDSP